MFGRRQRSEKEELKTVLAEFKKEQELRQKSQVETQKGQEEILKRQEKALEEQAEALKELAREQAACREQIDSFGKDTGRQLKRHSEAIEDMLEEKQAQDAVLERYEHQIRENGEREDMLLALLCRYQEEFTLIEENLQNMDRQSGEGWADQLALFKRSLEGELRKCAIEETGSPGEQADYRYHEILDTEDTEEPERDGTVAHCYRTGCIYHGRVVTKARVRVYRSIAAKKS